MKRFLVPALAMSFVIALSSALVTNTGAMILTFQPTSTNADGVVGDRGIRDGIPDFVMTGPLVFFAGLQGPPHAAEDDRGVIEFNTPQLVGRTDILRATLALTEYATEPDSFNLYGYEGNGIVDPSDFLHTANLLGSGATHQANAVGHTLVFDVTTFVQTHPVPYLGFLLVDPTINTLGSGGNCCAFSRFVSFDDLGSPYPEAQGIKPADLPTLTVEFEPPAPIPEPSTLILLCSGLAGLGGMAWRRHRRG